MGSRRVKSSDRIPVLAASDGKLRLIAVAERFLHPHNRLHDAIDKLRRKAADSDKTVPHLILLKHKLLLIGKRLNLAAAAAPVQLAPRLYTESRRTYDFLHPRVAVILLQLRDTRTDFVADERILNKKSHALIPADSLSVHAQIFNLQ